MLASMLEQTLLISPPCTETSCRIRIEFSCPTTATNCFTLTTMGETQANAGTDLDQVLHVNLLYTAPLTALSHAMLRSLHLSTDKPVYRPGEPVYWRAVLLDMYNHSVVTARPPDGKFIVKGPKGICVLLWNARPALECLLIKLHADVHQATPSSTSTWAIPSGGLIPLKARRSKMALQLKWRAACGMSLLAPQVATIRCWSLCPQQLGLNARYRCGCMIGSESGWLGSLDVDSSDDAVSLVIRFAHSALLG